MMQQEMMQKTQVQEHHAKEVSFQETREREYDSQAPPDLEQVSQPQTTMPGQFQGQDEGYEPSADELIDVLKNLENLAAGNPRLYRSIVEQIKGNHGAVFSQQQQVEQVSSTQYEQQMYEQQLYEQQQQMYEEQQLYQQQELLFQQQQEEQRLFQQQQEQQMMQQQQQEQMVFQQQEQTTVQQTSVQQQSFSQKRVVESRSSLNMSEEEYAQYTKMKRLEAEAQEEVRMTLARQREMKMKKHAEPQRPKEITVIAGDGKNVKIQLIGDQQDDTRKQVAEAAGLKHVPLPDFDDTDNSAWAGSLRKTKREQREEPDVGENPWAGTLRHVKEKGKKSEKKEERDDLYGGAPWMGTLRHVVHDNKVTKNYGVNQMQSKREEMARKEEEEELERIRSNIGSKTVSSALLTVLMPKLLKMHETKYSPMDKVDAEKIMEEILGMQIGINPDQQADANEEAEMIIRAIMQDEVDKSVYSRMADDLEAANKKNEEVEEGE